MAIPLFTNEEASDPGYCSIRDGRDPRLKLAKWHCEYLWILFERHADNENLRCALLGNVFDDIADLRRIRSDMPEARAGCRHNLQRAKLFCRTGKQITNRRLERSPGQDRTNGQGMANFELVHVRVRGGIVC
jgi:hypothetical protein